MATESATYIDGLDAAKPTSGETPGEGDDHLRLIKSTIKATFPNVAGAVSPTHTELNFVDGVTSAIQTQLDAKAAKASPPFTGTATFTATTGSAAWTAGDGTCITNWYLDGASGMSTGTTSNHGLTIRTNNVARMTISSAGAVAIVNGVTFTALTPSKALVLGSSKEIASSVTTAAELAYVSGVTSAIQDQLNALASVTQAVKNENYTLVLTDANKHIYKSNTSAYAWTVPANASVAFPIGTVVTMINGGSSGDITITRATDVAILTAGSGTDSNKTLAAYGVATLIKVATNTWYCSGLGVS